MSAAQPPPAQSDGDEGQEEERRPPMWKIGSLWSLTADPYLDSNGDVPMSDVSQSCAVLRLMLRDCPRLSPWSGSTADGDDTTKSVPSLLTKCGELATAGGDVGDSVEKFDNYVNNFLAEIGRMNVGGAMLIPGGWSGPTGTASIIYVAERVAPTSYALVVCNASPDGLGYHPSTVDRTRPADKILYRTCIRVDSISQDRFLDKTFWAVIHSLWIKPSEFHRAEVLYDVLLPWLSGRPTLSDALRSHYADCTAEPDPSSSGGGETMKDTAKGGVGIEKAPPFWRTQMRSVSSSPMRNVLEAVRYYLVRYANATKGELKRLTTLLKAEALGMALADLNDAQVEEPPNTDERVMLELACRTVAHSALKIVGSEGWGAGDALRLVEAVKTRLVELEETAVSDAASEAEGDGMSEGDGIRPDPFQAPDLVQADSSFQGIRVSSDDVEQYAGPATEPRTSHTVDFLNVAGKVRTVEEAVALLTKCTRVCRDLNERCQDGSSYSSRVALQLQVAQIISHVFTEILPVPVPNPEVLAAQRLSGAGTGGNAAAVVGDGAARHQGESDVDAPGRIWSRGFPSRELQLNCLSLVHQLALMYAWAWQSFDAPSRAFESEKAVVSLSLLAVFDCVLRHDTHGVDTASVLREDGGFCLSTSVCVANLSLYRFAGTMELHSPKMAIARARCLDYFEAVQRSSRYSDLFIFRMPTDKIEVKKYGTSVLFLRKMMERCGYELVSRNNPQPPPEIESLMEWLTSPSTPLAREHREFGMLRDMACLYKFLATMESRESELQRQRIAASEYVSWSLSFEDTSMDRDGTFRGSRGMDNIRGLRWEVLNYRGLDLDTADVQVTFSDRKIFFGEGGVHSPADITALLNHKGSVRPTEDDILHADALPTYGDTLSRQESEMLMSYLTVPYMRIPLCLAFFATGDRVTYLFSHGLQALLRAVLFDSGDWVPQGHEPKVEMIPVASGGFRSRLDDILTSDQGNAGGSGSAGPANGQKPAILGTSEGLLLNELCRAPEATLRPLMKMLTSLNDLAEASVYSPDASLSLYLIELALDVQAFFHEEGVQVTEDRQKEMTSLLTNDCRAILRHWLREAAASDDLETMCMIHSYLALIWTHTRPRDLTSKAVGELMGSLCFVRNWHGFGLGDSSALLGYGSSTDSIAPPEQRLLRFMQAHGVNIERVGKGSLLKYVGHSRPLYLRVGMKTIRVPNLGSSTDEGADDGDGGGKKKKKGKLVASVPEQKLIALLQMQRGPTVAFLEALSKASNHLASRVLSEITAVALDTKANWLSKKESGEEEAEASEKGAGVWTTSSRGSWLSPDKEMTLDLQGAQVMWRNDELKPLPDSMTIFPDYHAVFGRQQMHCGLVAMQQHRHWVHVVGTCYDLLLWDEPEDQDQGIDAPRVVKHATTGPEGGQDGDGIWICPMCTYRNQAPSGGGDGEAQMCQMCGTSRNVRQGPAPNTAPAQANTQPGDADDMKSKSPSAIDFIGVRFDRELDPFDEESLKKFDDEGEMWALKLLVACLRGHYKEKLPFKVLLPTTRVKSDDHIALAMAGVVTQHDTGEESEDQEGLPPPMQGRGSGAAFSIHGFGSRMHQQDSGKLRTTWKEFVLYRERKLLQVFNLASHGRKLYRQLVYSSDSRLALHSLEPSKSVFGANGDLKTVLVPDSSLVITRSSSSSAGVEILVPGRLLAGTVPGALIEAYRFWHSTSDNIIRGEPLDPESTWFGGHVIEIMPDRTVIKRQLSRREQRELRKNLSVSTGVTGTGGSAAQRRLVVESASEDATVEMDTNETAKPQFPETAVMDLVALGFSSAAARLALTKCSGNSAFAAEWLFNPDNAAQVASAEDREQISSTLFRVVGHGSVHILSAPATDEHHVHRWRTPDTLGYGEEITVVERSGNWLRFVDPRQPEKDRWVLAFDPEKGTILEPVGGEQRSGDAEEAVLSAVKSAAETAEEERQAATSRMDIDEDEPDEAEGGGLRKSKLVNMLDYPAKDSGIFRLLSLLINIEDLSHILVWANIVDDKITHIELPRLKLRVEPRSGQLLLTDQAGWYICKHNRKSRKLLDCHSLLLMNGESEVQFLVPNHEVTRPKLKGQPFTTKLLCDRGSFSWLQTMDTRFYLFKVHTSGTFLVSQELAASIYLVHLKLLQRRYREAFALAPSCTVDVPFANDEGFIWGQLKHSMDDRHPDAHACRLRLSLAVMYANGLIRTPWEAHLEMDGYLRKLSRVSAACRLTKEEEGKVCQLAVSGTPLIKNRLAGLKAPSPSANADFAAMTPRVGGSPWHKVQSRPLSFYNNHGTSLKRIHFRPEIGEGGFDRFSMDVIFNELVVADEESGANRQLGFTFLYQLIITGEVPGATAKPLVTGEILARYLHLKLSRWGRESVATGEVEVSSSRHMAQLAALLYCQHERSRVGGQHQQIHWPNLPTDEQSVALASNGVNLYTEPGVSSGVKTWLDLVDMEFVSVWPAINEINDPSCRMIERQEITDVSNRLSHGIQPAAVEDTGCHLRTIGKGKASISSTMACPLYDLHQRFLNEEQGAKNPPKEELPFDLYNHPAAQPAVACDILKRLEEDVKGYAISARKNVEYVLKSTEEADLLALINALEAVQKEDLAFVHKTISSLELIANRLDDNSDVLGLQTAASHRDKITFELLTQALLSRHAADDLKAINPTLTNAATQELLDETIEVLVRANRISHSSRTVSLARKLLKVQGEKSDGSAEETRRIFRSQQLAKDLAVSLSARRFYLEQGDHIRFDPRFLVFEYVFDIILRNRQVEIVQSFADDVSKGRSHVQQMIMGAGKTTVVAPLLTLLLADGETLVTQVMPSALLEQTRHIMRSRFAAVIRKRVFTLEFDRGCEDEVEVALRVFTKLDEARRSRSVVCASPDAVKSLFLKFVEHVHSLENVDKEVLTPSTSLRQNKEIVALREVMQSRSDMSDALVPIFDLWREGVLIMDEVDVLLHPLRSELNFPIGNKDPIDLAGFRWDLPMALLRVFFPEDAAEEIEAAASKLDTPANKNSYKEEQQRLLHLIQQVVEAGYTQHALQRSPHLVLLDEAFYREELRILAARWSALWIIDKCNDIPQDVAMVSKYLYLDGIESEETCRQTNELQSIRSAFAQVSGVSMKLLNLGRDWIRILLPHVLSKIDRVSFGILSPKDLANVDQTRMPISRKLMAVPFVGKDVPSRSSEFAHPDVVIGLSVLGYRYEGLRESDVRRIVMQLKADFARQVGPRDQRPACLLFRSWLEHAARHLDGEEETQQLPVLPLPLFQANDPKQLKRLHQIVNKEDRVISYYLQQHVFPACMNFQNIKISACGHELGSNMLFRRRVGFSGTPSNLLPTDLGQCLYEPGSDGKVMHILSSPEVVKLEKKNDWTARSILRDVAAGSPDGGGPYHALIDTGALITGMDNEEVARYLLEFLPPSLFEGVVYLDHADRKMFLQRSSNKSLHLSQCGVDPSRRFTFYDQVHTTGMDIKQAPDARAVVTLGKDMTFRDYAQGSFRMRGIGNGQTINIYLIPEVEHLIRIELHQNKEDIPFRPLDVPAWLLVNSMKTETVQYSMLSLQELFNIWRKEALEALVDDVKVNSPLVCKGTSNVSPPKSQAQRLRRFLDAGPDAWIAKCVSLFREPVGFVVPDGLPQPQPFSDKVNGLINQNSHFVKASEARDLVRSVAERVSYAKDISNEALEAEIVNENEQEQQQQQEEEAEEEQEKISRFTRDDEQANPWSVSHLNETPTCVAGEAPFYRFREFAVRSDQPKLLFPENLLLSDNFFRPRWIGLGDRRLKNVLVVLEWYPKSFKLLLAKLVPLLHQHLVAEGLQPTPAALRALSLATMPTSDAEVALRRRFVHQLVTPTTAQAVGMGTEDCFYVAVSLAEAESLRRILHTRQGDTTSAFSLLSIEDSSCIDSTPTASSTVTSDQKSARMRAASCLRFINGDMHYTPAEISMLQNAFAGSPLNDRIQFFEQCLSLRRREKYLWGDTPLAKLFTEEAEWHLLDARAKLQQFGLSLVRSLRLPGNIVDLLSMFSRLDTDGDGALSHAEMQRLLEELQLGFSPADIAMIINIIDCDDKHKITWELLIKAMMLPPDLTSRQPEDQRMEEEATVWACSNCTFRFNDPTSQECEVCGYGWDGCLHVPADKWMCDPSFGGCTFFNSKDSFFCSVCDKSNPTLRNVRF